MNSSSLHTWEVEEYSCPCKRLTDKRRHRIRETQTRHRAWKVITCLNSFGKKCLRSGAWTSVSPLRTKYFCAVMVWIRRTQLFTNPIATGICAHAPCAPQRRELIQIRLQLTWAVICAANLAQIRLFFLFRQGPEKVLHFPLQRICFQFSYTCSLRCLGKCYIF